MRAWLEVEKCESEGRFLRSLGHALVMSVSRWKAWEVERART